MIALSALAGCAGGGPRVELDTALQAAGEPAAVASAAAPDTALTVEPAPTATPAELTRWSAARYGEGRHDDAVAVLERWLAANVSAPAAVRAALAVHYEALGRTGEAEVALAHCAADDPAAVSVRAWLGLRGDGFAAALVDARHAVELSPASAADRNNLGVALLYAGRPEQAREAFLAAHELDPRLPGAAYNLAIVESVYFFDDDTARAWLAKYRRLDDDDPDGLFATLGGEVAVTAEMAPASRAASGAEVLP